MWKLKKIFGKGKEDTLGKVKKILWEVKEVKEVIAGCRLREVKGQYLRIQGGYNNEMRRKRFIYDK